MFDIIHNIFRKSSHFKILRLILRFLLSFYPLIYREFERFDIFPYPKAPRSLFNSASGPRCLLSVMYTFLFDLILHHYYLSFLMNLFSHMRVLFWAMLFTAFQQVISQRPKDERVRLDFQKRFSSSLLFT